MSMKYQNYPETNRLQIHLISEIISFNRIVFVQKVWEHLEEPKNEFQIRNLRLIYFIGFKLEHITLFAHAIVQV